MNDDDNDDVLMTNDDINEYYAYIQFLLCTRAFCKIIIKLI